MARHDPTKSDGPILIGRALIRTLGSVTRLVFGDRVCVCAGAREESGAAGRQQPTNETTEDNNKNIYKILKVDAKNPACVRCASP